METSPTFRPTPAIIPILPEQDLAHLFLDQFKREFAVLLTMGFFGLLLAPKPFRSPLSNLPLAARPKLRH